MFIEIENLTDDDIMAQLIYNGEVENSPIRISSIARLNSKYNITNLYIFDKDMNELWSGGVPTNVELKVIDDSGVKVYHDGEKLPNCIVSLECKSETAGSSLWYLVLIFFILIALGVSLKMIFW